MADERNFELKIITPERVFYEGQAVMVEFNTTEGEIGVYKQHIPLTVIVKPGILTITEEDDSIKEAALHAGFVEILPDKVTIMAEIIEWPGEIDTERAEAAKERAENRLGNKTSDLDVLRAETALQRAVARLSVTK
jgi:F-type H+-transporting ATPase subunit epsilon